MSTSPPRHIQGSYSQRGRAYSAAGVPTRSTISQGATFLSFLGAAQALRVPFIPITWERGREAFGIGGTALIDQTPINAQTSLAFKRVKNITNSEETNAKLLKDAIQEITVLSQSSIRNYLNVVQLEGICWNVIEDKVWPVLIFEKSEYGDMSMFYESTPGLQLSVNQRLKLATDVGKAIFYMHSNNIIHGDIKPENVLVFTDNNGTYIAKVTDFGYSSLWAADDNSISMPSSQPWTPPEHDGTIWLWTPTEAEKMDIFSLSMLWLWILFERNLARRETLPQEVLSWLNGCDLELDVKGMLHHFKRKEKLSRFADLMLESELGLDSAEKFDLMEFFTLGLSPHQDGRDISKSKYSDGLLFSRDPRRNMEFHEAQISAVEKCFKIEDSIEEFYDCDYRVRRYIVQCLNEISEDLQSENLEDEYATDYKFQQALCYYIGFGVPQDQLHALGILSSMELTESDINTILLPHLRWTTRFTSQDKYRYTFGSSTLQRWGVRAIASVAFPREDRTIDQALEQLLNEKSAIERLFGTENPIWLILTRSLSTLYYFTGNWKDAEKLVHKCLSLSMKVFGEENPHTLVFMSDLSWLYKKQKRLKEAEKQEIRVKEISTKILGPEDPDTLTSISNLASIYKDQHGLEKAVELEELLWEMRTRILGPEHPDTITTMSNLATTYYLQGRSNEAEKLGLIAIGLSEKVLGEDHPDTLASKSQLGTVYCSQERYDEAEAQFRRVFSKKEKVLGPEHPSTLLTQYNLAAALRGQHQWAEAEDHFQKVVLAQLDRGDSYEAIDALEECIKIWMARSGLNTEAGLQDLKVMMGKYMGAHHSFAEKFNRLSQDQRWT